jgi:hypothetical protein
MEAAMCYGMCKHENPTTGECEGRQENRFPCQEEETTEEDEEQ